MTLILTQFDRDLVIKGTFIEGGCCTRVRPLHAWRGAIRGFGGDLAVIQMGSAFLFVCRVSGDNRFRCLWPVDADDTDLPSEARSAIHARQSGNEERVQV